MPQKKLKTNILFFLFASLVLQAQEASVTAGGEAIGSGGTSSYSIGQIAYTTNIGSNGSLSEGVQQAYEISTTLGIEITEINLTLKAYPNPTINNLTLQIGNYINQNLSFQLFNLNGKKLKQGKVTNDLTVIGMNTMPTGAYLLSVLNKNSLIKTFRIIKK